MNQKEKTTEHNSSRPRMPGERLMGRAGNWEIISTDCGIVLNKLDSGCWHGTPGFSVEELPYLKACVESTIETHCNMVANDASNLRPAFLDVPILARIDPKGPFSEGNVHWRIAVSQEETGLGTELHCGSDL